MTRERLFSLLKNFASHIDEFDFVKFISLKESSDSLWNQSYFSLTASSFSHIKQFLKIIRNTKEFLQDFKLFFANVSKWFIFWASNFFLFELWFLSLTFFLSLLTILFFHLLYAFLLVLFLFLLFRFFFFLLILIFNFRIFIVQNDLLVHLGKILSNKLLFLVIILTLFLFIFNIVFPFKIFMFFNQCNKKATSILIMRNESHRILKANLSSFLLSCWWKKSLFHFRILSIFIFFIKFKLSFWLPFLIFLFFLNNTTDFPVQQSSSTFYTIHVMNINDF